MKPIYHQLTSGQWRVTNAPKEWQEDGRAYPATQPSDQLFDLEREARTVWLARLLQRPTKD